MVLGNLSKPGRRSVVHAAKIGGPMPKKPTLQLTLPHRSHTIRRWHDWGESAALARLEDREKICDHAGLAGGGGAGRGGAGQDCVGARRVAERDLVCDSGR